LLFAQSLSLELLVGVTVDEGEKAIGTARNMFGSCSLLILPIALHTN